MDTIEHATRREWLAPLWFLAIGAVGALFALSFRQQAFPEASIELRLSRLEIAVRAERFLHGRGIGTAGYRSFTTFDYDDDAKAYLEQELGVSETRRLMADSLDLWRWKSRFIRPPRKEEATVWLTPSGTLAGFDHQVEEDRPGARLNRDAAQRVAEVFLRVERGYDLARFRLVGDQAQERPRRLDYTFTWESQDVRARQAPLRVSITVLGDEVGGFREFLRLPAGWVRNFERLRGRESTLRAVAWLLQLALFVAAAVVLVVQARRGRVRWATAIGWGLAVGLLFAVARWNNMGLAASRMPTDQSYQSWLTTLVLLIVLGSLVVTLWTGLLVGAGESLYRERMPQRVSLGRLFTFSGIRSREFLFSTLVGYGMAGIHAGLLVLFYLSARRLGLWVPLDVGYRNILSTAIPWIGPLAGGLVLAVTQESGYRMLAIPLLAPRLPWGWLALAMPGILWGVTQGALEPHPTWTFSLAMGVIGVCAGWVFLRYGVLATLVWNYTVHAMLGAGFLLRSQDLGFRIAGGLVADAVLLPLAIAGVLYVRWRGFLHRESILNGGAIATSFPGAPRPPAEVRADAAPAAPAVVGTRLARFAIASVVLFAGALFVRVPEVGDATTFRVNAHQAEAIATRLLQLRGVSVARLRRVTSLEDSLKSQGTDYLREHLPADQIAQLYAGPVPLASWRTRFSRPPDKEEYSVEVAPDGHVLSYRHTPEPQAAGVRLEKPEALARARTWLAAPGVSLGGYRLIEHRLERREGRNDHTLTWESAAPIAGEATHRITVWLDGDEIGGPRHSIHVPESWAHRHSAPMERAMGQILLFTGLAVGAMILFLRGMARAALAWRLHLSLGAVVAFLALMSAINEFRESAEIAGIPDNPAIAVIITVAGVLFAFLATAALSAMAELFLVQRFGRIALRPNPAERGRAWVEALAGGACGVLLWRGLSGLVAAASDRIPAAGVLLPSGLPSWPAAFSDVLNRTLDILGPTILLTLVFLATGALALRVFRSRVALAIALLGAGALYASNALGAAHFLRNWLEASAFFAAAAATVSVLRFNVAGYFVFTLIDAAAGTIAPLWRHPALRPTALETLAVLGVVLVAASMWALREPRRAESAERPTPTVDEAAG